MQTAWITDTVTEDAPRAIHYTLLWGLDGVVLRTVGGPEDRVPFINEARIRNRLIEADLSVAAVDPGLFEAAGGGRGGGRGEEALSGERELERGGARRARGDGAEGRAEEGGAEPEQEPVPLAEGGRGEVGVGPVGERGGEEREGPVGGRLGEPPLPHRDDLPGRQWAHDGGGWTTGRRAGPRGARRARQTGSVNDGSAGSTTS